MPSMNGVGKASQHSPTPNKSLLLGTLDREMLLLAAAMGLAA